MTHDELIQAEWERLKAESRRLIEKRDEALRRQGHDPAEWRARIAAMAQDDPDIKRRVAENLAQAQRGIEQAKAHESFYAAAPARRKAPRSMI